MPFRRLSAHTERATTVSSKPLGCEALLKKQGTPLGERRPLFTRLQGESSRWRSFDKRNLQREYQAGWRVGKMIGLAEEIDVVAELAKVSLVAHIAGNAPYSHV